MNKQGVISKLRDREKEIRAMGVSSLSLFGSVARDDASETSDVDLFFDYDDPRFSLIEFVEVKDKLSVILGRKVDIATRNSLHPELRPDIEASAIRVF
jgi:uncharacterized protein